MFKSLVFFSLLLLLAVAFQYYTSGVLSSLFYVGTLVLYFRSQNEAFWLAFFLAISDGFMGFFGAYEAVLSIIPGLPSIEVGQLYILLTVVKATKERPSYPIFFRSFLIAIAIYILFLIVQGYVIGLSLDLNVQFRVIKYIVPLLLFYSLPRLFKSGAQFAECFQYLFIIAFSSFFTQMFAISFGTVPSAYIGATEDDWLAFDVSKGKTYRAFFSTSVVLITTMGAMFFLAQRRKSFPPILLYLVLASNFLAAFLSATRGWILSLGLSIFLFFLMVVGLDMKRFAQMVVIGGLVLAGAMQLPLVNQQVTNAVDRLLTLEKLASGDVTAGGTLVRLNERGPRVMRKWQESPLTGLGFSDEFWKYHDVHVGNQNLLLHSGIVGGLLMALFFLYFNFKLLSRDRALTFNNASHKALLVFPIFFLSWFFIHSTSSQQFAYYSKPGQGMVVALFFTMAGFFYVKSFTGETIEDETNKGLES